MIPQALKDAKRWILWKYEDGRKVPYSVRGFRASSMKASHWTTYAAVFAEYADDPEAYAGLGFVLGDGFCGVDLDGCRDKDTGVIDDFAREIISECGSYWEVSPSGTGVKIFCTGVVPKSYKRMREDAPGKAIEVYGGGRYFAVTDLGDALPLADIPPRLLIPPDKPTDSDAPESNGDRPPQWEDARAAVLDLPPSIEHNGSHNALLQAVCEIARWGLPGKDGMDILLEYNRKKSFHEDGETQYLWTKDELKHKWRDGWKKAAGEIGKRLYEYLPSETVDEFDALVEGSEKESGSEFGELPTEDKPTKKKTLAPFRDYPLDCLEPEMSAYIRAAAQSLSCATAAIAVPFLVATGGIIGNKRWADPTGEWEIPPNLWAAVISPPGTAKSSIADKAFVFLNKIENDLNAAFLELWNDWNQNADKKKVKPPERRRLKVLDTTMEALIGVYRLAPNGIVIDADELTGWVNSIGQYKQGQGNDKAHWLGFWTGKTVHYDRKTGEPAYVRLDRPIVSISGGIQPQVLADTIYAIGRDDGLLQRLLVCMPPPPGIDDLHIGKIPVEITGPLHEAYERLHGIQVELDDNLQESGPTVMSLAPEALAIFRTHRFDLKLGAAALDDIYLRGHWNKLDTYTIRFAIILELFKWSLNRGSDKIISQESMAAAIRLTEWHQYESYRVYKYLALKSTNKKRKYTDGQK